jgi:hypothetical protein
MSVARKGEVWCSSYVRNWALYVVFPANRLITISLICTGENMKLTIKHYGIILFCLITAYLHLSLYPDFSFVLNGVGYISLLAAYFLPIPFLQERDIHVILWWGLVIYTVTTILLWVIIGDMHFVMGTSSATGYYAKTAEILLLTCLWADRSKPIQVE